jgi:hypothetical protein
MTKHKVVLVPFPRVSSTRQLHRLMTATTAFIRRQLGQLSPEMQKGVNARLRELFALKWSATDAFSILNPISLDLS